VRKALKMKIIYVIAALTMLAMLIPAMAIPASAAGSLAVALVDSGLNVISATDGAAEPNDSNMIHAYNLEGSIIRITASGGTVTGWDLQIINTIPPYGAASWYNGTPASNATVVYVKGEMGEARITATFEGGGSAWVNKKWGTDITTEISASPSAVSITWNETSKSWYGTSTVTDIAKAVFFDDSQLQRKVVQGALLNFYLFNGDAAVPLAKGEAQNLKATMSSLTPKAIYSQFIDPSLSANWDYDQWHHTTNKTNGWLGTGGIQKVTDKDGKATIQIGAWFKEAVQVVVIPEYPNMPNVEVTPEITSINFRDRELEVVPQVRWVGEKIVLEATFGDGLAGKDVNFYFQNQSVGTLESLDDDSEAATVWTTVNSDGIAMAILTSYVSGQADVAAALYPNGRDAQMTNQYAFRVYFLDFLSLTLGDVSGKRAQHNAGLWQPSEGADIWDTSTDMLYQEANVSQDVLERAQVRGWFMPAGDKISTRPDEVIDLDADGTEIADADPDDMIAPAGHWVLPDDWAYIGGYTSWQTKKLHWDIMDSPADDIAADTILGDYKKSYGSGTLVGPSNTIGPFAPGIEVMTPSGWMVSNPDVDDWTIPGSSPAVYPRHINTVVPNGELDIWDAPMPPAKVSFQVLNNPATPTVTSVGYFKAAMKKDIYYMTITVPGQPATTKTVYTAPFYQILVPAHEAIIYANIGPGGSYDWNSFNGVSGPYEFWKIVNRPDIGTTVPSGTPGDGAHPTYIEVYSDNHGEAMAFLNGDWNLKLDKFAGDNGYDVYPGATVGLSYIRASADNPYVRSEQVIFSNTVEKEWFWSGYVLGMLMGQNQSFPGSGGQVTPDWSRMVLATGAYTNQQGAPGYEEGKSDKHMVWLWISDRDGKQAGTLGSKVDWHLISTQSVTIDPSDNPLNIGISQFNTTTKNIFVDNGFLRGTKRLVNPLDPTSYVEDAGLTGHSVTRAPTTYEKQLFQKFYGSHYTPGTTNNLSADDFSVAAIEIQGGATALVDVVANITTPREGNIIRHTNLNFAGWEKLDDPLDFGDANADGKVDMADVVTVERIILGLAPRSSSANASWDANPDGSLNIDMGDVVRIEKIILTGN